MRALRSTRKVRKEQDNGLPNINPEDTTYLPKFTILYTVTPRTILLPSSILQTSICRVIPAVKSKVSICSLCIRSIHLSFLPPQVLDVCFPTRKRRDSGEAWRAQQRQ